MSYNDEDEISEQFVKINSNTTDKTVDKVSKSVANTETSQFFNISDKIIDKLCEDKYLIKISFRELMAYASPIVFNRDLEQSKIDELYTSVVDGYAIPFTLDAIYDKKSKVDE